MVPCGPVRRETFSCVVRWRGPVVSNMCEITVTRGQRVTMVRFLAYYNGKHVERRHPRMDEPSENERAARSTSPATKKLSEGRLGKRQDVVNMKPAEPAQNVNQSDPSRPPVDPPPKAEK